VALGDAGYRAVLRIRDYRLLLSGLAISKTGSWAYSVGLAVFVFKITGSPSWVAIASLTRFATALLTSAYGGVIAERFERVRLMVALDLAALVLMSALTAIAAIRGPVGVAIALAALTQAIGSIYSPAVKATTPAVVGPEHLAAANSLESSADYLAIVAGPAIGAGLLLLGSPALAFGVNAASFGYSALIVSRIGARTVPTDVTEGGRVGPLRQMLVGVKAVGRSSTVALLVGFSVVASFVYGTDTVLYVVVSQRQLGTEATGYGYLLAGFGAGGIVAAMFTNRLSKSSHLGTIIAVGLAVYCLPTALLTVVHSPVIAFFLQVIRGGGTLVVDVLAITAMQRLVDPDLVARVFGAFFALVLAATAVGAIATPLLLAAVGLDGDLLLMGLVIPVIVMATYVRIRALDAAALTQLAAIAPRISLLQRLDIFAGASRPALERLAAESKEESVPAGTVIIREGEAPDDFFVLAAGQVEVSASGEAGQERVLGTIDAPAYFGEIGLLEHMPRTATVIATQPSTVYRIAGETFVDALTVTPLTPAALGLAQVRLARTHPSRTPSFLRTG
jgi:CRP-like cAMP-binding protein/predicted MFS family arabinose efflux permease